MVINILYLYYDLMNLYGESGNIKAILQSLEDQEIDVNLDKLSLLRRAYITSAPSPPADSQCVTISSFYYFLICNNLL